MVVSSGLLNKKKAVVGGLSERKNKFGLYKINTNTNTSARNNDPAVVEKV